MFAGALASSSASCLFGVIGTTAGTLVGLLFVVVSLRIDEISELADYNMRATLEGLRFNTIHLLNVLLEAAAVLTPQPLLFLGTELIAINLLGLRLPLTIIHRYFDKHLTISHRGASRPS